MHRELEKNLLQLLDTQRMVENLKSLINIKSVNPLEEEVSPGKSEKDVAEYYKQRMQALGMEIRVDEVARERINVFGKLKGKKEDARSLMLAGHLDVVDAKEEQFEARVEGTRVYGRGACDMKAALAVYLEVVRVIVEEGIELEGDLWLGGIADEEYGMMGSRYVGKKGPYVSQIIIGEPTELKVCPANKGQICLAVNIFGKAAHSSVPEEGINAIAKAMKAVSAVIEYNEKLCAREPHPLCGTATSSPDVIRGGEIASAIPARCDIELDRRLLPGETKEGVYRELKEIFDEVQSQDPDFKYEITEPLFEVPANGISENEPVVKSLVEAYGEYTGLDKKVYGLPFGTDAPNMGAPAVVCGPGSIKEAHGDNEFCEIDQLEKAARMYLAAVLDLLG